MSIRAISYGGGVQSTALVVLAAQGVIDYDYALFSNVGEDSEHPDTLTYVDQVMRPWLADKSVELVELRRVYTKGPQEGQVGTVRSQIAGPTRSIGIPVRPANGAPGNRACTIDFKIRVVGRWLRENGATKDDPATVAIGFSTDEWHRVNNGHSAPYEHKTYPLLDLRYDRAKCQAVIADAGLPVPPKSSCYFCPFHSPSYWAEMRRDRPDLFEKAQEVEDLVLAKRAEIGRDAMYLTRFGRRLTEAIPKAQESLFGGTTDWDDQDDCDTGYCFV